MEIKIMDGALLSDMFKAGLANLRTEEQTINELNVFPVPDGDTGSNMRMTIENGVKSAVETKNIGEYVTSFARGVLLGARGNSGVITSQFFKGISLVLKELETATIRQFADALVEGYKVAYKAVVTPTEGTILTVCREAIELTYDKVTDDMDLESLLKMWIIQAKKSLEETPEKLAVLKEAGVVDSGGAGLVTIFEGFLKFLGGEILDTEIESTGHGTSQVKPVSKEIFNADSVMTFGYCTEFILQLLNSKCNPAEFDIDEFVKFLESIGGNSIVALKDEDIVKIHVHTFEPWRVFQKAQQYGELVTLKAENMDIQNAQTEAEKKAKKQKEHKAIAYVAVCQGEGIINLYKDLGCDVVVNGGQTMNTSTEEFVEAFKTLNADNIIVFPNNKNIVMAAEQARDIYKDAKIHVIKTGSVAQGYFAFSMMDVDETDVDAQLENIMAGIENVTTVSTTRSIRDTSVNGVVCKENEPISIVNHTLVASDSSAVNSTMKAIATVEDIEEKEVIVIFKGQGVSEEVAQELQDAIGAKYPCAEVGVIDGQQDVYDFILGIC